MEEKRNELAEKLNKVIETLYRKFENAAVVGGNLNLMLRISDRIIQAAGVIARLYDVRDTEEQIAMLEKALSEDEA